LSSSKVGTSGEGGAVAQKVAERVRENDRGHAAPDV